MKPSGVAYDHKFMLSAIESGIVTNRDGIGGAVRKSSSNILRMNKGYYNNSKEAFYKWLKNQDIQPEDEVLVHLRWGTNGSKTIYNQHPYILGEKSTLNNFGVVSELTVDDDDVQTGVFAHNGIFSGNEYEAFDMNLSDTYNWGLSYFRTDKQIQALINSLRKDLRKLQREELRAK
jgi:predicted glutamine amidotransferase